MLIILILTQIQSKITYNCCYSAAFALCLIFIFLQLLNPYISPAKNAAKQTTTEICIRNVKNHKRKTAEAPYLFYDFDSFILPLVLKLVLTFHCEHYIRYHNDHY